MFNSDPVKATRMDRMDTDTRQAEAKAVPATQGIGEAAVIAKNLLCSRFRGGLLISIAIAMWISTAPTFSASPSPMSRPVSDIQAGFGRLLRCQWQRSEMDAMCLIKQIAGSLDLSRDPAGKSVESVEITALVARHPKPRPDAEKLIRDTVLRIVTYLLPR